MTTHDFRNDSDQAERQRVERDTYLTRAQSDADLASQGRFKRETATRVTGVPVYPSMPSSSPWANGFDQNIEPPFPVDIEAHEPVCTPTEIEASIKPALIPLVVAASHTTEVDREGGEPVVGSTVDIPSTDEPVIGSFARRRSW